MAEAKQKATTDKNTKSITVESGIEGINADILSELATILTDLQRVPAHLLLVRRALGLRAAREIPEERTALCRRVGREVATHRI